MKTVFKKGMTVYWGELKGEVVDITSGSYPVKTEFAEVYYYFTEDGGIFIGMPPVLSITPYTLNGFSQDPQIEKDTLVYVRDLEDQEWKIRYYSHFDNGKHHCFINQYKAHETKHVEIWESLETENPLLK